MATKTTTKTDPAGNAGVRRKNFVLVEGYLKENTLELIRNARNEEIIRGALIIAVDELNSHKIQFYVSKFTKDGKVNKDFTSLQEILPGNVITIAEYLKTTPTANFATASNASTKVWCSGRLEEYTTRSEDRERTAILLKGRRAGIKSLSDRKPFNPRATFSCDMFIEQMLPEAKDGEPTGRIVINGLLPVYDGSVHKISFVTEAGSITDYVSDNYSKGQTANFEGNIISIQSTVKKESTEGGFGSHQAQYETTFIRERVISGGAGRALDEGDPGSITLKEVKDGLATREAKIIEAGSRKKTARPASFGTVTSTTPDDMFDAEDVETSVDTKPKFDFADF